MNQPRMPLLFLGHGSPMNAIENNSFTQFLVTLKNRLPTPKRIIGLSAHWITNDLIVDTSSQPKTIYDFYGFPHELYQISYPARGDTIFATQLATGLNCKTTERGLDHGLWTVLRHIYPEANIPIIPISLTKSESPKEHYEIGKKIAPFLNEETLFIASGDTVHNLQKIDWRNGPPDERSVEFDQWIKRQIISNDRSDLLNLNIDSKILNFAHPTKDHLFPLFVALGIADNLNYKARLIYEEILLGTISMNSFLFN